MGYSRTEIIELLKTEGDEKERLFAKAAAARDTAIGDGVYLRGLIEYSNICSKNCLYCGIRRGAACDRYTLTEDDVLKAARYAWTNGYGSVVIQGGENTSPGHIATITSLVRRIVEFSSGELGITLSLGEQTIDTYREWLDAGAHRYLLRIEASNESLYRRIHPNDDRHDYKRRLQALYDLRTAGYIVGTGVMIGLPFQSVEDLADDLLFMRDFDIDMCGMGPYIVSEGTPLAEHAAELQPELWRMQMTLKMIAVLRLLMPDINIAATTALQAIDPDGRLKAIAAGANVVMPNLTPDEMKGNYSLYNNKPMFLDTRILEKNIRYGEKGDSRHFTALKKEDS